MDVIPFSHTWPYERQFDDIYFQSCPFCGQENVLLNMKKSELNQALEGIKTSVNLPCCRGRLTILEADQDYFWTNKPLRKDEA
ncbi:hypothetical protein [Halalkalibacter oceani]|uniref:Uncharacterized protein n=1 Tax=Halalkalibacter oceani TaxID=1653776 RepID=A0A9X2DPI1_9BACI|nr:hypothetical protein [Halalkalibacter oceani]MCM3714063.1 hypothetical protein [Halalkalibacter oceani]